MESVSESFSVSPWGLHACLWHVLDPLRAAVEQKEHRTPPKLLPPHVRALCEAFLHDDTEKVDLSYAFAFLEPATETT